MPENFKPDINASQTPNPVEYFPYFEGRYLSVAASLSGGDIMASFVRTLQQGTHELGQYCLIYCSLRGPRLMYYSLRGLRLLYCSLRGPRLMYCSLRGPRLMYCALRRPCLMYCSLGGMRLMYCSLRGSCLMYCFYKCPCLMHCSLRSMHPVEYVPYFQGF